MKTNIIDDDAYEEFEARHLNQLLSSGVPEHYWRRLCEKLVNETYDAGAYFQILAEEEDSGRTRYSVVALKDFCVDDPNNIFLIDHAWTFRPQFARRQLREVPGLLDRICSVFDIPDRVGSEHGSCSDYGGSGDEEEFVGQQTEEGAGGTSEVRNINVNSPTAADVGNHSAATAAASATKSPTTSACGPGMTRSESIVTASLSPSERGETTEEKKISEVLKRMWQYIHTYTLRIAGKTLSEDDMPLWYMPDEFGVRIGHSDEPNFRMVPMFYGPEHAAYSLLYPIKAVAAEEVVTRDYADTIVARQRKEWRVILMHPWNPVDFSSNKLEHVIAPDSFFTTNREVDVIAKDGGDKYKPSHFSVTHKFKICADDTQFTNELKYISYELVETLKEADVVWLRNHFHDYSILYEKNPNAFVNQFPNEAVLTVKDIFAASVQSVYQNAPFDEERMRWQPLWFPTTFNLNTELPQFVAYFQRREMRGKDNTWIIKPWNLARGMDMHVTDNLSYIIRLVESGPKLTCKYIHRPVLVRRPDNANLVKFDLRYIVMVRSLKPVEAFVFNKFWIRFAINDFSLRELDDRETHLTVFNYDGDDSKVLNMNCEDFIVQLEKTYPNIVWKEVQKRINDVIKESLEVVTREKSPRSVSPNGQSRAIYGYDIMLEWDSEDPKTRAVNVCLIEANFMPDCARACKFYLNFADTVFKTLFTNEEEDYSLITKL
ncbi:hypothetical protein AB6A40_001323 [Gnathostoma spinigerum]|uniref:Tubulin--tyrosine ligase-like protein 12 SET-like domain-containing protein n=1 Tax=Gnathostoma spinigerum TaxID=75299 RepID=A0ABD6EB93_9BILA